MKLADSWPYRSFPTSCIWGKHCCTSKGLPNHRPTATCYETVNQTGQRLCNGRSCNAQESLQYVITSHGSPWIKLKQYALHIFHLYQLEIKIVSRSEMLNNLLDTRVILKFFHTLLSAVICSYVAATHLGSVINSSFSSKTILDCIFALLGRSGFIFFQNSPWCFLFREASAQNGFIPFLFELFFCKKKIPLSWRVEYVMDGSMDESVSEWVSERCMSHQSDWIYYKQPIKFFVVKVNGMWKDLIPIQFRTAIFILL